MLCINTGLNINFELGKLIFLEFNYTRYINYFFNLWVPGGGGVVHLQPLSWLVWDLTIANLGHEDQWIKKKPVGWMNECKTQ